MAHSSASVGSEHSSSERRQGTDGAATVAYVGHLVHSTPDLLPVLQEHLDDLDGAVLPHLLMADIERWAETEAASGRVDKGSALNRVLMLLESGITADYSETRELVSVSFLEHIPRPEEPGSELRSLVGPRCAEVLTTIG